MATLSFSISRLPKLALSIGAWGVITFSSLTAQSVESDYTLFVGVDLFMKHHDDAVSILKLENKRALLNTPERDAVLLSDGAGFSWKMATKVSSVSATIADLDTKPVFSPANDPKMQTMKMQSNMQSYLSERVGVAQAGIARAANQAVFAESAAANPFNSEVQSFDQSASGMGVNADAFLDSATLNMDSLQTSGLFDDLTDADGNANQFDAMEVSFTISSSIPMANAFVVIVAQIKSGETVASTSFHREIGQVTTESRRFKFMQVGLPLGFQLESSKIYLFNYGEEVATNLSEKQYKLTSSQAREYLQFDYMGEHRRETLNAQPAWSIAPSELVAANNPRSFNFPVTVDLDATGSLTSIHDSGPPIPAHVRSIVERLTFLPALEKGKPVASTITVNPADFFKN
jgi:hypothetical protein